MTQKIDLVDSELEFYSRQIVLADIGYNGQLKLRNSKVCIVGLGGLGSPAALQLAAMGMGHLRLVDCDIVELSNLQRQPLYSIKHLGYPKVEAAEKRLSELNPNIAIEPLPLALNVENAEEIIKGVDVVVDGLDRMTPRYALNRASQKLGVPYIFAAAITTYGNVSTIIPQKTACLECFQGGLKDDMLPKCAVVGVHPSILNIIASVEVSEAIKIVLGHEPQLANRLLYCDIGNLEFDKIEISRAENCPVCSSHPSQAPTPLKHKLVNELCGRRGKRVFAITPKKDLQLDIDRIHRILGSSGYDVEVKTALGLGCRRNSDVTVSVLKSGIMIIEGARSEEEAYGFYSRLVVEEFKIPSEDIGVKNARIDRKPRWDQL
jgi:adenylyltransferase/sulfurtransferase